MTNKQKELARHALGLPNSEKTAYRNHFCIESGGDGYEEWTVLVQEGLATKATGGVRWVGDFFFLTLEGAKMAMNPDERLNEQEARKLEAPWKP